MAEGGNNAAGLPAVQAASPIFATSIDPEFRQGEIISGIVQFVFDPASGDVQPVTHEFGILASQDCDLLQDHTTINEKGASGVNGVLVYEAHRSFDLKAQIKDLGLGSADWKRIRQNNNDRYHAIQSAPAGVDSKGEGLPDLVVDFRRFFTIGTMELMRQVKAGDATRRCRLEVPYKEHFQARVAFYLARVGVPVPHILANAPGEA